MYFIQSFALHCVTPLNRTFLTRAEENRFFIVQMKYKTFDSTYGFQFIYIYIQRDNTNTSLNSLSMNDECYGCTILL